MRCTAYGLADLGAGYVPRDTPTTNQVTTVSLKRKLSVLLATVLLAAPLTACDSGGETDDGNSGDPTPTAPPTNDDGDSGGDADGDDDGSQHGPDGSGE